MIISYILEMLCLSSKVPTVWPAIEGGQILDIVVRWHHLDNKQLNCSMLDCQHSGGGMNDVMTRIMPVLYDWVNVVKGMYFTHCMLHP